MQTVSEYTGGRYPALTEQRKARALALGATHIVDTRYELDAPRLPAALRREMAARGLRAVRIGSTTYCSSTWALVPVQK